MTSRILIRLGLVVICLSRGAVVRGQASEEFRRDGNFLLRAETTFQHYCAPCHGETAQGDGRYFGFGLQPPPRDLTDATYLSTKTDEDLVAAIAGGSASIGKSNLCPPWENTLGRERIRGLVGYLRSLTPTPGVQDTTQRMPLVMADSFEKGSAFQLTVLVVMCILLAGAGWVQWRDLDLQRRPRR